LCSYHVSGGSGDGKLVASSLGSPPPQVPAQKDEHLLEGTLGHLVPLRIETVLAIIADWAYGTSVSLSPWSSSVGGYSPSTFRTGQ